MQRAFQPIESFGAVNPKRGDPLQFRHDALSCRPSLNQSPTRVAPSASSGTTCQQVTELEEIQHNSIPAVRESMPDLGRVDREESCLNKRSEASTHVRRYRYNRDEVELLADHGPET